MKTHTTIELFQYWNRLRNGQRSPARSKIEPSDIRNVLANTFILESHSMGEDLRFRLAGTGISNLFGTQLRGTLLRSLFQDKHKPVVSRLMRNCYQDFAVVLLSLDGTTKSGRRTLLELLLLPLQDEHGEHRILGCLSAHQYQFWHGLEAVNQIDLQSIRIIDPEREPLFLSNRPEIELPPSIAPSGNELENPGSVSTKRALQLFVIQGGKTAGSGR